MKTVEANGVKIAYQDRGKGAPVLLTHGYGVMQQMWDPQAEGLGGKYRFITWDIRGHGQSASPDDPTEYSEAKCVADIGRVLDACGVQKAVIGGLSLGGYMSLAFYHAHPERVRALVLCDTGPGFKADAARQKWNDLAEDTARKLETKGLAALAEIDAKSVGQHSTTTGLIHAARGMFRQKDSRIIESLPTIKVPTLVVIGEHDAALMAGCQYMAKKIPGAKLVVVPRSGHYPNLDEPRIFNDALDEFLAGLPPQ